jgi:hypothetical protein
LDGEIVVQAITFRLLAAVAPAAALVPFDPVKKAPIC